MFPACLIISRGISTTCARYGKRNFRKFLLYGKRGSKIHKEREAGPNNLLPVDKRGVRDIGYYIGEKFVIVPEMIPELVVPSLEGFNLKPYVTYESENVTQEKFTAKDLFTVVYGNKIEEDFKNGKLTPDGEPLHPSEEEKLTPEEAEIRAAKTGADMFDVDKNEVLVKYKRMHLRSRIRAAESKKTYLRLSDNQ